MALKLSRDFPVVRCAAITTVCSSSLGMLSYLSRATLVLPIVNDESLWTWFEIQMYMQAAMAP